MRTPARGPLWVIRTAVLAVGCTALAWGGHVLGADGAPENAASLGAFSLATLLIGVPLARFTRTERGFGEVFAVLAAAQVVLHLIFQLAAPPAVSAPAAPPMPVVGGMAAHSHVLAGYSAGMLAGHLWAALLAAALLSRGEHALWTLFGLLERAVPRYLGAPRAWAPPAPARRTGPSAAGFPRRAATRRARPRAPPPAAVRSVPEALCAPSP